MLAPATARDAQPENLSLFANPAAGDEQHGKLEPSALSYSLDTVAQLDISEITYNVFVQYISKQIKDSVKSSERLLIKNECVLILRKRGFFAEAEKMEKCHSAFSAKFCEEWHAFDVKVDYRCYLPFCPDCQREKSIRELKRILPKFLQALKDDPFLIVALLTLTIKSKKERALRAGCKEIKSVGQKLRRRKIFSNCVGGTGRIENTYSKRHSWHPHAHLCVLLKDYIAQAALSDALSDITGGESKIVDIRSVHDVSSGLVETLKYPFKIADIKKLGREQIREVFQLKGERLGVTFGSLYGLEVEEEADKYQQFVEETKALKNGCLCPICRSRVHFFPSIPRSDFEAMTAAVLPLQPLPKRSPSNTFIREKKE